MTYIYIFLSNHNLLYTHLQLQKKKKREAFFLFIILYTHTHTLLKKKLIFLVNIISVLNTPQYDNPLILQTIFLNETKYIYLKGFN
jgi:hypothetical protein